VGQVPVSNKQRGKGTGIVRQQEDSKNTQSIDQFFSSKPPTPCCTGVFDLASPLSHQEI
jgi:hypothetical protein